MQYLYLITNHINHKVYLGQTNNPNRRWASHKTSAKKPELYNTIISRALAKHGVANFSFEVIATCRTIEDADNTEIELIKQYNSREPQFGYNVSSGGYTKTEEERQQHSTLMKAKYASGELEPWNKGQPSPGAGVPRSPEVIRKIAHTKGLPEHRRNVSAKMKGKQQRLGQKRSEAERAKTSATLRATWAKKKQQQLTSGIGPTHGNQYT